MKKEITVIGKESDWFEKAVFTLKDGDMDKVPKDLFSYAEELVEKYLKRFPISKEKNREYIGGQLDELQQRQNMLRAYKRQTDHYRLRQQKIHLFFILSMGACLISILVLAISIL